MCKQTYCHRSKSSRPSIPPKKQKPSKQQQQEQLVTKHFKTLNATKHLTTLNDGKDHFRIQSRRQKSVSFNEVVLVMIRPLPQVKAKKIVSFSEIVVVRPVLHHADYTDQEMISCFSDHSDRRRIKFEILHILRKIRGGTFEGCSRGLEKVTEGGRTIRQRRRDSTREVLDEQEVQRAAFAKINSNVDGGHMIYNSTKLRKVYKKYSRVSRHDAHAMGKSDGIAAALNGVPAATHERVTTMPHKKRKNSKSSIAAVVKSVKTWDEQTNPNINQF